MEKIKFPNEKIKSKHHHYWCDSCEFKFCGVEAKCPNCGSKNVVIDDGIDLTPIKK